MIPKLGSGFSTVFMASQLSDAVVMLGCHKGLFNVHFCSLCTPLWVVAEVLWSLVWAVCITEEVQDILKHTLKSVPGNETIYNALSMEKWAKYCKISMNKKNYFWQLTPHQLDTSNVRAWLENISEGTVNRTE